MSKNNTTKNEKMNENETVMMPSLLVGYVRRSNAGGAIKLSINNNA